MSNPKYGTGDTVYLRESASIGILEAWRIGSVSSNYPGQWLYTVEAARSQPTSGSFVGDRKQLVTGVTVFYTEDSFVSFCEALSIARQTLTSRLEHIDSLLAANCDLGTDS